MELGSRWGVPVLVTGGDLDDDHDAMDVLLDGENSERFHGFRLQVDAVPGKGECLSTAIAAQLGWGATLAHAISEAKASIAQWILTPSSIGQGLRALCPSADPMELDSPHP